jgi:hypothetical protein
MSLNKLLILSLALALGGCSFSDSSKSSAKSIGSLSDSVSSPSTSLSNSSMNDREKYERDVRDYTAEFVVSSDGNLEAFRVRLGKLAESRGISNWSDDRSTYIGIGKGLRQAKLTRPQYEAFRASLGNSDPRKMDLIRQAYE